MTKPMMIDPHDETTMFRVTRTRSGAGILEFEDTAVVVLEALGQFTYDAIVHSGKPPEHTMPEAFRHHMLRFEYDGLFEQDRPWHVLDIVRLG